MGEQLAAQGPRGSQGNQGNQGNRGEKGAPGLSISVRRSLVYMGVVFLVLVAANFLWSARQQNAYEASLARDHVAHLKADELMVEKLCLTFGKLGALKPPAGPAAANPARAYEQEEHATLIQLGTDLGCK